MRWTDLRQLKIRYILGRREYCKIIVFFSSTLLKNIIDVDGQASQEKKLFCLAMSASGPLWQLHKGN